MSLCVIFDLDGTLVDSETLCQRAFVDLLPGLRCTVQTMLHRYQGEHFDLILADLVAREDITPPGNFEALYRKHLDDLIDSELQPMPGALEMLRSIDYPRCIASGGPMPKIRRSLRITGMDRFFGQHVFSSYAVGSWKPDPGLFLHAAKEMGFRPDDCVVIEDSPPGIEAATRAGMRALLYAPFGEQASTTDVERLSSWTDLPVLLEGNSSDRL